MTHAGPISGDGAPLLPGQQDPVTQAWRRRLPERRLVVLLVAPTVVFAAITIVMQVVGIAGWDAPAHLYKMSLLEEEKGIFWDNNWYGGAYDLISYGFIFYFAAKIVGYSALVAVSAGAIPALFFLYMRRIYGRVSYVSAIGLAVVLAAYLANGQDPFLFAMALMLGGMVLLAYGHPLLGVVPIAASLFANPLAITVGVIFLLADFIATPLRRRLYLRALLYLTPFLIARVLLSVLFFERATYVYHIGFVLLCTGWGAVGFVLTRLSRDPRRRERGILFLTFVAVGLAVFVVPGNPVGSNILRFFFLFGFPLYWEIHESLVPKYVLVLFLAGSLLGQIIPPLSHYSYVADQPSTKPAFFFPALDYAARHNDPDYRIHVVALDTHWEAYHFSVNGFPITRGWFRQADALHNEVLNTDDFSAAAYVRWLRTMGVRDVYLPHAPLDWSGDRESQILRTSPDFKVAWRSHDWTVYRLRHPSPIAVSLEGGENPHVLGVLHQAIYLDVPAPGRYLLKVSYSPYWMLTQGIGGLRKARGAPGFLELRADEGGMYGIQVRVTLERSLRRLVRIF
jgi:hypothetical protein